MGRFAVLILVLAMTPAGLSADAGTGPEVTAVRARFMAATRVAASFDCRDVSCSKLSSCEEACYKLRVCGQSRRDGDGDGIPCENLCSRRCP